MIIIFKILLSMFLCYLANGIMDGTGKAFVLLVVSLILVWVFIN